MPKQMEVVKRLEEEQGYARRTRDEKDSKVYRIYATEAARDDFEQRLQERAAWRARLNTSLTEEERITFCTLCDKISNFLELEQKEHPYYARHYENKHIKKQHHGGEH